ncbi:MAG TPA: T9SS type A sorting domain-containing protein [Chitinophagales bacterium]|nr:T9SS type A sorting domain-containing protein [Chitinophagales bacterium]
MKQTYFPLAILLISCAAINPSISAQNAPVLQFVNPTLTSGTAGHQGAVYKFANVIIGIDARVTINALNGGATLGNIDLSSAGYGEAWQPIVNSSNQNNTCYIEWKIRFKKAGTTTDTVLPLLSITAVDVDGNGVALKEKVSSSDLTSYFTWASCNLTLSNTAPFTNAVSTLTNITDIDTAQKQAMIQLNYTNINEVTYRTGTTSTNGGAFARQHCLYFKSFTQASMLPIELVQFNATVADENRVELSWQTGSEMNNDYFTIERSSDAVQFESIAELNAAGNSLHLLSYAFVDANPLAGNSYYRLKQTDLDGSVSYSDVRMVEMNTPETTVTIFPNPATMNVSIQFPLTISHDFSLFNVAGQRENIRYYSDDDKIILDISHLSAGTYFLQFENGSKMEMRKIIVQ